MAYKLGPFEFRITFTPRDGGDPVEAISTPSAFALAEEWADELRATGRHSAEYVDQKFGGALFLLAAQDAGLARKEPLSMAAIMSLLNAYDIDMEADEGEPVENPTPAAPEAAQDAL